MDRKKIEFLVMSTLALYGQSCTKESIDMWCFALKDYRLDLIEYAFKKLIRTRVHSSVLVPAEVCKICDETLDTVARAYQLAKESISYDRYIIDGIGFDANIKSNPAYEKECADMYQRFYDAEVNGVKKLAY